MRAVVQRVTEAAVTVRNETVSSIGSGLLVLAGILLAFGQMAFGACLLLLGAILEGLVLQDEFINKEIVCAEAQIADKANEAFNVRLLVMMKKEQALDLWGT